ncbi:MAG: cysteine synthase family protein [Deltaproteobacteria bacterium]|jgi:cysteine synthase B|nr:cysteine synthase family protein [Deltaproteobacteria bacterium]
MNVLDLIGNTPLLSLDKIVGQSLPVKILAKAEFMNPTGSVKDRAAKGMILAGINQGLLTPDKIIIDATSGNTGISFAMIASVLNYRATLYLPSNANHERKSLIRAFGANIVETNPLESSDGAFLAVKEEVTKHPETYFYPDQYNNPINPLTHYQTTGKEILEQTEGKITHFICALGTSGTFMGTARRLKIFDGRVKCVTIQPDSPFHGIEGTKHMASTIRPGIYNRDLIDSEVLVSTQEAHRMTQFLAKNLGLLVGISSGANVFGALKLAKALPRGSIIVTILGDTGTRYLSGNLFSENT